MNTLEIKFFKNCEYNTVIIFSKNLEGIVNEAFADELEIEILQGKIVYSLRNHVTYYLNLKIEKMKYMKEYVQNILCLTILNEQSVNSN